MCVMLLKLSVLHSQLISGDYLNSEPYHMLLLSAVLLFRFSVLISHKFLSAVFLFYVQLLDESTGERTWR